MSSSSQWLPLRCEKEARYRWQSFDQVVGVSEVTGVWVVRWWSPGCDTIVTEYIKSGMTRALAARSERRISVQGCL